MPNLPLTPRTFDNKPIVSPNIFPGEVVLNFAGRPDVPGGAKYGGNLLCLQQVGQGDAATEWGYNDVVSLAGAYLVWEGGGWGSWVRAELYAPASTVSDADPPNTGNASLCPVGGGVNLILPASGNGAKSLGASLNPLPSNDDESNSLNGYWDYTDPWLGKGSVSAGSPGVSKWNMLDQPITLARFLDIHLSRGTGERELMLPAILPKWILPHWLFKVTIHNEDAAQTLKVSWDIVLARRRSA